MGGRSPSPHPYKVPKQFVFVCDRWMTGGPRPRLQAGEFAARSPRIATFAAAEALKGVVTIHRQRWLAWAWAQGVTAVTRSSTAVEDKRPGLNRISERASHTLPPLQSSSPCPAHQPSTVPFFATVDFKRIVYVSLGRSPNSVFPRHRRASSACPGA